MRPFFHLPFPRIALPALFTLVFATIYGLISFVNHALFRTYTLDLGFYTNALFDYRHFSFNDSSLIAEQGANMLGGHFEPILFLLAPLSFLFGTYTLLLVQIAFIIAGGLALYAYFLPKGRLFASSALLFYYGYFTLFAALAFDFHTNVLAASLLPFLFLFYRLENRRGLVMVFCLMILCKENISLWLVFVFAGMAILHRKQTAFFLTLSALSALFFVSLIQVIIPAFSEEGRYGGFLYSVLGNSPKEALCFMVTHPFESLRLLFVNHSDNPLATHYKLEFHVLVFLTGLPLLLRKPAFLLMTVPLYFQKMLHDDPSMWGVGFHYGAEFAPLITLGVFSVAEKIHRKKLQTVLLTLLPILSFAVTFRTMDRTLMFTDKNRIRFYQAGHFHRTYPVKPIKEILHSIPADAIISAQSPFIPHLALRETLYQFPIVKDATFVLFSTEENPYPLSPEAFTEKTNVFFTDPRWELWKQAGHFYVFKKRP
jgi:uncharacterized membrane protein